LGFPRELIFGPVVLVAGGRIVVTPPHPLHRSFASVLFLIIITRGARRVVHDGTRLQAVR
jgi:hypothetical protein